MKELIKAIGKAGHVSIGGLYVAVKVVDIKQAYGRDMYLVTPVKGSGEVWITKVNLNK